MKPGRAKGNADNDGDGADADYFFSFDVEGRGRVRQLYRPVDATEEWVENNYYRRPIAQQNADLVGPSRFWLDYARHVEQGADGPFLSEHVAGAASNFTDLMLALAVLDLPAESPEHEPKYDGRKLTLTTGGPAIVFHEQIRPAQPADEPVPILVSQNFYRQGDRHRDVNGEQVDKFVQDEFLAHVAYGCQVVVTNPTSSRQKLDVLLQVPVGAVPVLGSRATRSVHLDLEPYHTETLEYHFYFPTAGKFAHYPVHVSKEGRLVAHVEAIVLDVVEKPTRVDRGSWVWVSQNGTDAQVLKFLAEENLYRIDLAKIAFRMKQKAFFTRATRVLARRHVYNHVLWSYSIEHDVTAAIAEFLDHAGPIVAQSGAYLESPLLVIDPVERRSYEHMDYSPLVNARAHQLGRRRQILNDRLHGQYHRLLNILSCKRDLDSDDRMALVYYLLLQDRVAEAIGQFSNVTPEKLATRLQYDYFAAFLDFYNDEPQVARPIVEKYADHPVEQWRDAFASVRGQLDEIEGAATQVVDDADRDQLQGQLAATEPSLDLKVEAQKVRLDFQNMKKVRLNYFLMDIELLFSRNPFVQQHAGRFSHIRPNLSAEVELPGDAANVEVDLPEELRNRNVLVEAAGSGVTRSQAYYSNDLAVQVSEGYGQLRVARSDDATPLPKVYVKVYARRADGQVAFYKDGYTDLRGRFDYASLSQGNLGDVERFALLVLSDEHGASVREARPPGR